MSSLEFGLAKAQQEADTLKQRAAQLVKEKPEQSPPLVLPPGHPAIQHTYATITYSNEHYNHHYWIEDIRYGSKATWLLLAAGCWTGHACEIPYLGSSDDEGCLPSYLTDKNGRVLRLRQDQLDNVEEDSSGGHIARRFHGVVDGQIAKRYLVFRRSQGDGYLSVTYHSPCENSYWDDIAYVADPPKPENPMGDLIFVNENPAAAIIVGQDDTRDYQYRIKEINSIKEPRF